MTLEPTSELELKQHHPNRGRGRPGQADQVVDADRSRSQQGDELDPRGLVRLAVEWLDVRLVEAPLHRPIKDRINHSNNVCRRSDEGRPLLDQIVSAG